MKNPQTLVEWQDAVDGAEALLLIDSARQYGLITGGPIANFDRCVEILKLGAARGIKPSRDCAERMVAELMHRKVTNA